MSKKIKRIVTLALTIAVSLGAAGCGTDSGSASGDQTTTAAAAANDQTAGNSDDKNADASNEQTDGGDAADEAPKELKTIRIGSPSTEGTTLGENAGLAYNYGFLEEELEKAGYKAEYYGFGQGGTAVTEALISGQLDVGFVGDLPCVIAASNGIDSIEVIAALNKNAEMGILVNPNAGINSVEDLKGKKIAVGLGTINHVYTVNLLESHGMSINDVEVINDYANGSTLLATGDVDAFISNGMGVYIVANMGIGNILTTSRENPDHSVQFFCYGNKSFFESEPAAAEAIIKALLDSKNKANEDPDSAYAALETDYLPIEIAELIYPRDIGFDMFDPYLTQGTKDKFNTTGRILFEAGVIGSAPDADSIFNTKYLDSVYSELGLDIPS